MNLLCCYRGGFMKLIEREYLGKLIDSIGTPDIKVITGVRRSGKSKLMERFIEYLRENYRDANVIHINFSLIEFEDLRDYHKLYYYIKSFYKEGFKNFVCIDEVQMCEYFEKAINSLHAEEIFDIYLTGSNAFLLSSDIATLFTGRCLEISVYPFSYSEYLRYFDQEADCFDNYFVDGGMAGSYLYANRELRTEYVKEIYTTVIERDLIKRKNLKNRVLLLKIASFLMDNIGNLSSASSIATALSSPKKKVSDKTVASYIKALCEAFLFYRINRYDIKGKKYLVSNEKYYLCDASFKYAILGKKDMNYGRAYENIVAIELLRRGYEVYIGVLREKEIDFVAMKQNEKLYIQVSDNISNEDTFNREVEPLLKINDAYPKLLIARTRHEEYTYEGVKIVDIDHWLRT